MAEAKRFELLDAFNIDGFLDRCHKPLGQTSVVIYFSWKSTDSIATKVMGVDGSNKP